MRTLTIFWLVSLLAIFPAQAEAKNPSCPPFFKETFLQPTTTQVDWSQETWNLLFSEWHTLGIESVVIQWSHYGKVDYSYEEKTRNSDNFLMKLFNAAEKNGIRLILGLTYDPDFWQRIAGGLHHRAVYFEQRRFEMARLLKRLSPFAERSNFAGWYIADEIDDMNWRGRKRREQLIAYLRNTRLQLAKVSPHPVSISTFSNGDLPAGEWANFWQEILEESGIEHLYFQDGLGAGKLEREELSLYLDALKTIPAASESRLMVITELFERAENDRFRATDWNRLRNNLSVVTQAGLQASAFAFYPYLDPQGDNSSATLYRHYREAYRRCEH